MPHDTLPVRFHMAVSSKINILVGKIGNRTLEANNVVAKHQQHGAKAALINDHQGLWVYATSTPKLMFCRASTFFLRVLLRLTAIPDASWDFSNSNGRVDFYFNSWISIGMTLYSDLGNSHTAILVASKLKTWSETAKGTCFTPYNVTLHGWQEKPWSCWKM